MDERAVREHAEAHGQAVVAGDMKRAGSDLSSGAREQAPAVMGKMPKSVTASEVGDITPDGDEFVAVIRYVGDEGELVVESRWADSEGRPKITHLRTLEG